MMFLSREFLYRDSNSICGGHVGSHTRYTCIGRLTIPWLRFETAHCHRRAHREQDFLFPIWKLQRFCCAPPVCWSSLSAESLPHISNGVAGEAVHEVSVVMKGFGGWWPVRIPACGYVLSYLLVVLGSPFNPWDWILSIFFILSLVWIRGHFLLLSESLYGLVEHSGF